MPGMAAKVVISERQQRVLQTMAFSRSSAKGLAHRAEIILLAFEGHKNEVIAEKLQCERHGTPSRNAKLLTTTRRSALHYFPPSLAERDHLDGAVQQLQPRLAAAT